MDTASTLVLKASEDCDNVADIGFADIAVGDVIAWLSGDGKEPVPGRAGAFFDGYVVPHAGSDGAWLSPYGQEPYYEYYDSWNCPGCGSIVFNRLGMLVGWFDMNGDWHGLDGHPEPSEGDRENMGWYQV